MAERHVGQCQIFHRSWWTRQCRGKINRARKEIDNEVNFFSAVIYERGTEVDKNQSHGNAEKSGMTFWSFLRERMVFPIFPPRTLRFRRWFYTLEIYLSTLLRIKFKRVWRIKRRSAWRVYFQWNLNIEGDNLFFFRESFLFIKAACEISYRGVIFMQAAKFSPGEERNSFR